MGPLWLNFSVHHVKLVMVTRAPVVREGCVCVCVCVLSFT